VLAPYRRRREREPEVDRCSATRRPCGTDAATGEVTMTFLVITITTGRCGVADLVGARVGDASAAGLGDSRGSPTA